MRTTSYGLYSVMFGLQYVLGRWIGLSEDIIKYIFGFGKKKGILGIENLGVQVILKRPFLSNKIKEK